MSFAHAHEAGSAEPRSRCSASPEAILFNSVRTAISKADWYESGYLANLTAYAISKLSLEISRDSRAASFDLLRIWDAQAVGESTLREAVSIAEKALDVLTSEERLVGNVTEWAKRESAWNRLSRVDYKLSDAFLLECIPVKLTSTGAAAVTVHAKFPADISERRHVQDVGVDAWRSVQSFLGTRSLLTAPDRRLLAEVLSGRNRMLDVDVARGLLRLYVKALNHGSRDGGR